MGFRYKPRPFQQKMSAGDGPVGLLRMQEILIQAGIRCLAENRAAKENDGAATCLFTGDGVTFTLPRIPSPYMEAIDGPF